MWPLAAALIALTLCGCADFVILHPTPTPNIPVESLPPIGFNHRYGNSPITAADGFDYERSLFAAQAFWEVGVRGDPQLAGFVDRTDPHAVIEARAKTTALTVSVATERLSTIQGMLAFATDAGQQEYCVEIVNHFRSIGYSNITKATVLVFFTEQDEHAVLAWTPAKGYTFTVNDNDLRGNSIRPGPAITPLPQPS